MSMLSEAIEAELADREILTAEFKLGGRKIKVASWPLSPADFLAINKKCERPFQQDPTQFEGQIEMLIRKVRSVDTETGKPSDQKAFDISDRAKLMVMGVEKISTMFADLFKDQIEVNDDEDVEGN